MIPLAAEENNDILDKYGRTIRRSKRLVGADDFSLDFIGLIFDTCERIRTFAFELNVIMRYRACSNISLKGAKYETEPSDI